MCLAVPGRIVSIEGNWASADVMGVLTPVNIQLLDNPAIGEHILIHTGCALQKISRGHSQYLQRIFNKVIPEGSENGL